MIYRQEYPRPQFVRKDWMNLNGEWDFTIDHAMTGEERNFQNAENFDMKINVPFCPESKLSGIEYKDFMRSVWYTREVDIPEGWTENGRRTFINIGACDYITKVFVNGILAGRHVGGYVSFSIEITEQLKVGKNRITIFADDDTRSQKVPSGKQCFMYDSVGCFYTRSTGIWQTVWLENTPKAYLKHVKTTPNITDSELRIEATFDKAEDMTFTAVASFHGKKVGEKSVKVDWNNVAFSLPLSELHLWDTENPNLYDITFTVGDDKVDSYFGMREIALKDNKTYLNGKLIYQRLILDQGYYPDGIYTAPSEEELINDIKRSMDMGFNGARLHEKIFEPLFLYHCDRLGYIVWGEFPNWSLDVGTEAAFKYTLPEWLEELERDYNHPAIIGWCPYNETQGNVDPDLSMFLFNMTKAYDPTRLFIDNSGWTHVKGTYDMLDVHDYLQNPEEFRARYMVLAEGKAAPCFVPFPVDLTESDNVSFISEFGGIWWQDQTGNEKDWGYGERPKSREEFIARYKGLMDALLDNPKITAFCYTQLTDVEQETNGLYTYDRNAKFDPAVIKAITSRKSVIEE
ncbi:MAG: beta-galactosidase [Ruminococcaceae bacterium]|nr:beta-galactosidase [Oscillospiraceae bacterium]